MELLRGKKHVASHSFETLLKLFRETLPKYKRVESVITTKRNLLK